MASINKGNSRNRKGNGDERPSPKAQGRPSAALLEAKRKAMRKGKGQNQIDDVIIRDDYEVMREWKDVRRKDTAVIWDKCMLNHRALWDDKYPECPERLSCIIDRCKSLDLLDRCVTLEPRAITKEEILELHSESHLETLASTADCTDAARLEELSSHFDAVYFHPSTYEASLMAAGSAVELVDAILDGKVMNGMALIRPPGHHAMKNEFCGYSFLNNVALCAQHALNHKTKPASRILIVDWDVHHGQGTQQMFYEDPRVLYFSIHRYENGEFWPNLAESDFDYIGEGKGKGFNINVPLNETGMENKDYFAIFKRILMPVAYEFQPDLILVSAGYDAALGCPEFGPELVIVSAGYDSAVGDEKGEMEVSPAFYAHLTTSLCCLAGGKIAVILEGGYCLKSLAEGAALTLRALLGDPCPTIESLGEPSKSIQETILNLKIALAPYWMSFAQPKKGFPKGNSKNSKSKLPQETSQSEVPVIYPTRDCYPVQSEDLRKAIESKLDSLIAGTRLSFPEKRVCLVYDDRMLKHKNMKDPSHPEKPDRLTACINRLQEYELEDRCHQIKGRLATEEELLVCHELSYIEWVKQSAMLGRKEMIKQEDDLKSIYLHPNSFESACAAAGSLLEVIDTVLNETCLCGVAAIRPPGHHAEKDEACGFCFFNNVSIAANYAIRAHDVQRVLILDWDVHHGNGTQHIFISDPKVMYISLHRYDNGSFFPGSEEANYNVVGEGLGKGFNVNIPWNKRGVGDIEYLTAFQRLVLPIVHQFAPQLVLLSAGFDAAVGDPLGGCRVTPEAYAHMTNWLSSLAGGKVVVVLEGGYNITSTSLALVACTKALLGDPLPPLSITSGPQPHAATTIQNVINTHREYWSSLEENVIQPVQSEVPVQSPGYLENTSSKGAESLSVAMSELHISFAEDEACGMAAGVTVPEWDFPGEAYAVVPVRDCPHLNKVAQLPEMGINPKAPCQQCDSFVENWVCLTCYSVFCGRYVNEHMMFHGVEHHHPLTLGFSDLSVWCYGCEAYVDNPVLHDARNEVHVRKFGFGIPLAQQ